MIRWSEDRDCYRAHFGHLRAAPLAGVGAVLGSLAAFWGAWNQSTVGLTVGALLGVASWCVLLGAVRRGAWIEVLVRGGRVRWNSTNGTESLEGIEVRRFSVQGAHDAPGWIEAELPDGSKRVVLVHEDMSPWTAAGDVVNQLNEMLEASAGRPMEPAT